MSDQGFDIDSRLLGLVTMLVSSVWSQLGKIQNPTSGKLEKDLKGAQTIIDILVMLQSKTEGNLTKKEKDMLMSTISDLQINYASEVAKTDSP